MSRKDLEPTGPSMLRTILVLGRTSNLPTVWTNVLAGWFLSGGDWDWQIAWLALAVSALYLGGMTLNDAFDVRWDRQHAPERPVPSGAISERGVWLLGWGWMVAGGLMALLFTDAGAGWLAALVAAIIFYDWIHKRWTGAMWVMGACRTLVYVVAGSALGNIAWGNQTFQGFTGFATVCGVMLGLYVAGVTLVARSERSSASSKTERVCASLLLAAPIGPVILFALLAVGTEATAVGGRLSERLVVLACTLAFIIWVLVLGRRRMSVNIGQGVTTLLAGIVVVDALFLSLVNWQAALVCLAFLPIVRWLQTHIPAT